eukprot:CAMPEP_0203911290 /NCGR_PEP_ID=MMETSP0359-20131031/52465_1 /ASSEMBLY_ACC=CAM_ASM_000338 /TAXON_ID=268821 /ORGANISM="Scrippsiella Hangoei, Strain SHTV-5" /LENGTH=80 /DNA_ID=CAMNT_0050836967 /DNA_START=32 /DNA_END=271 /DNA_ORIENTATION=+
MNSTAMQRSHASNVVVRVGSRTATKAPSPALRPRPPISATAAAVSVGGDALLVGEAPAAVPEAALPRRTPRLRTSGASCG